MMALPALFKWEDCTPTQQIFPVLWYSCSKELHFWRVSCLSSFMPLALETSFRLVAKRRSGSAPCCSFFFCICFYVVLHRSVEHIPSHLSPFQNSLGFIICRWKNDNLTNRRIFLFESSSSVRLPCNIAWWYWECKTLSDFICPVHEK